MEDVCLLAITLLMGSFRIFILLVCSAHLIILDRFKLTIYIDYFSPNDDKQTDADEQGQNFLNVVVYAETDSEEACLQSLAFFNMDLRFKSIKEEATGTCLWLLENAEYKSWVGNYQGIFAVTGAPGSGKSTLLKFVLQKAVEQRSHDAIIASFFFDDCRGGAQKEPIDLLLSLTQQITVADADFRAKVAAS